MLSTHSESHVVNMSQRVSLNFWSSFIRKHLKKKNLSYFLGSHVFACGALVALGVVESTRRSLVLVVGLCCVLACGKLFGCSVCAAKHATECLDLYLALYLDLTLD